MFPGMELHAWLNANNISTEEFADRIGASPGGVRKWRYGERLPRPKAMKRIAAATQGAVTPNDFFSSEATA